MTKAQRKKVSLRNLKKARAAKGSRKVKSVRKAARKSRKVAPARKAGKRTVALRNLKKAHSARKRRKAAGGPRHKVRSYSYKRPAKTVRVKTHLSYEEAPKKRSSKKRRTAGHRKLSMKKSAVAARRRRRASAREVETTTKRRKSARKGSRKRGRRHSVRAHLTTTRRGKHVRVKRHMSREAHRRSRRRSGALENPMTGMELVVGGFTGVLGFVAADALDRVLATHALGPSASVGTDGKPLLGTDGKPLFGDTPPTTGSYVGLFNATAILAPMDWKRWLAGVGITATPFVLALAVKSPVGRSSLQFFGFGAGVRIFGKAVDDLLAYLFGRTSFGARLYDAESRAAALKKVQGNVADPSFVGGNFPTAGLGAMPEGCGCVNCTTGVGACCRLTNSQALPAPVGVPQTPGQPANSSDSNPTTNVPQLPPVTVTSTQPGAPTTSVAQPSTPVPVYGNVPFNPGTITAPPPAPVPLRSTPFTPGSLTPAPTPQSPGIQGAPRNGHKSPYSWGIGDDQAAE